MLGWEVCVCGGRGGGGGGCGGEAKRWEVWLKCAWILVRHPLTGTAHDHYLAVILSEQMGDKFALNILNLGTSSDISNSLCSQK